MAVQLYHVAGNPHSDTMLMAYIPRERVVIEVDAYSPGPGPHIYAANLLENIESASCASIGSCRCTARSDRSPIFAKGGRRVAALTVNAARARRSCRR